MPGASDQRFAASKNPCETVPLVSDVEIFTDKPYREHLDFRSLTGVSIFQPAGIHFYFGADVAY
jgi:hypothetical protein